ncbi:Hypothetical protein D9617_16g014000 [Elsinoe fawcettii]|nr:Hypothetical protein D9617_16g014000 [Elsinoe fawcettii]
MSVPAFDSSLEKHKMTSLHCELKSSSGHRPKSFAQDGQPASKRRKSIKATTLETDTQDPVAPAQHKELLTILNTHAKVLSASIGELGFYRTHHDEDPDRLFLILSRAISTTKQVYTALSETEMVGSAITDIDVTTIVDHLRAATRAIVPYLQAYDHLDLLRPDQSLIANIVVGFASVFSVGLEALASITYRRTREQHSVCGTSTAPPATSKRKRASVGTASLERIEVAVRQALIGHLSSLDPSKRHHVNIYEACLYWLVTDLGQVTSTLAGIKTPVGSAFHGSDDAKQYARLHGFHLLAILRTAMERAPRSFRLPASNRRTSLRTPSEDESLELGDRNNLNRNALAQMQRTLVKAILGDASPLDQATACIEEPKAPNLPPAKTTGRAKKTTNDTDADPAEAFQLELFEVLGWEILAYEGKLADFLAEDDE